MNGRDPARERAVSISIGGMRCPVRRWSSSLFQNMSALARLNDPGTYGNFVYSPISKKSPPDDHVSVISFVGRTNMDDGRGRATLGVCGGGVGLGFMNMDMV